jgi:hypothetical protein
MNVHIIQSGNRFFCGLVRNEERSFIPLDLFISGRIRFIGKTRPCPFCRAAIDASTRDE